MMDRARRGPAARRAKRVLGRRWRYVGNGVKHGRPAAPACRRLAA
ncbi:LysR family transcriptional regulator, partial [Burkholderia pseudomallei]|nr:LysR family transcriptional regulator [Burkholderia pseudomallei]